MFMRSLTVSRSKGVQSPLTNALSDVKLVGPSNPNKRSSYLRSSTTLIAPDRSSSTALNHVQSLNKPLGYAHPARPSHVLGVDTRRWAP
ncbi:hypothetical protein BC827DRAFT_1223988 [Russula dissimulans]|nr:hypothetical protein BC827DRAFT_1223988 [Russula dissimulans]